MDFADDLNRAVRAIAEEIGMAYERAKPVEPRMHDGVAYCPSHPDRELTKGKKSGWYCSERIDDATYCGFWWRGEGYQPPVRSVLQTYSRSQHRDRAISRAAAYI
jgi:hypothetical protein